MKKTISIVWVLALIIGLIPNVANAKLVACVGDSRTYGWGLPDRESNCYPAQLEKILRQFDPDWETQNFGVSGTTLRRDDNMAYVATSTYNRALASEPDVVIIALGGNDVKRATSSQIEQDFIPDYLALIDAFAQLPSHPEIFVCCQAPIYPNNFGYSNSKLTDEIFPRIEQLPTYRDVEIIDLYTPLENSAHLYLDDGLHHNTEGARMIAEIVASVILAFRIPPDFNGDEIVDIKDLIMLIEHWGQDEPLVDIFTDGIIDAQDLEVLMSYWQQEIFPSELVACWKLDEEEGDIAYNSISDNYGILIGEPTWRPDNGQISGALEFDGVNDYVETGFVLDPAEGEFSVFAWIKDGAPGQVIISQSDGDGIGEIWLGADALSGNLMTGLRPPGSRSPTPPMVSDFVIADGLWHHIGIVVTANGVRYLYVDGIRVDNDLHSVALPSSNGGLYFGTSKTLESGAFFTGLIDDVRIYNVALTSEQIEALAQ